MIYRKLILLLVISTLIISCNKDISTNTQGVIIKGTISTDGLKKSNIKSAKTTYSLTDARKILVFNSSGGYGLFNIEDSSFAARAMQGTAAALVFLGIENSYIGCLQTGGLNVLPLVS
jgi:hypothetical protein